MKWCCKNCGMKFTDEQLEYVHREHKGHCTMCNSAAGFFLPPVIGLGDKEYDVSDYKAFEQFCKDVDELEKRGTV